MTTPEQLLHSNAEAAVQRDQALRRSAINGVAGRLATLLLGLLSLALAARGLGPDQFGELSVMVAVFALLATADLGIGNALVARISALPPGDHGRARAVVGTGVVLLGVLSLVVLVLGALAVSNSGIRQFVVGSPGSGKDPSLSVAVLVVAATGAAYAVSTLGQQIQVALQEGDKASVWTVVGLAASAACVVCLWVTGGNLWQFSLAVISVPGKVQLLQTNRVLWRSHPQLRPGRADLRPTELRSLARMAGLFFALGFSAAVTAQAGVFIASHVLSTRAAGEFQLCLRLFGVVSTTIFLATRQFWPAAREALSRDDTEWVRTRFRIVLATAGGVALVVTAVLVLAGRPILRIWAGDDFVVPFVVLVAGGLWTVYGVVMTQFSNLLNAMGVVRAQVLVNLPLPFAVLGMGIWLAEAWGASGPFWGMLLGHLLVVGWPTALLVLFALRRLRSPRTVADRRSASEGAK